MNGEEHVPVSSEQRPEQHCTSIAHGAPIEKQTLIVGRQTPDSQTPAQQSALRVHAAPSAAQSAWHARTPARFGAQR